MSFCFLEAFRQKNNGSITEDEYLDHVLAHYQGVEHEEDDTEMQELRVVDLFGYSIWSWSKHMDSIKDISPFKDVFIAYGTSDVNDTQRKLNLLTGKVAERATVSLALLALKDRDPDVLKVCLDRGFTYQSYFIDAANDFEREEIDPEVCRVLQASDFRKTWPWTIPKNERDEGEETDPAEAFDYGGEYEVDW